jgi:hypothetical protein
LDERATAQLREVERNRPRGQHGHDRALDIVRRFQLDARDFAVAVGQNMSHPERTLISYRRMHTSYDRLSHRTEQVHLKPRVGRHLDRIHELVARIDGVYRRPSGPRVDWERVVYLAHQMDILADRVHDQAHAELVRRANPQYSWQSRDILARLAELRTAADRFHDQVERSRGNPAHLQADFDRLYAAQQAASSKIWSLEYRTRNDFYRLTDYMHEVNLKCFNRGRDQRHVQPAPRFELPGARRATPSPSMHVQNPLPALLLSIPGGENR